MVLFIGEELRRQTDNYLWSR